MLIPWIDSGLGHDFLCSHRAHIFLASFECQKSFELLSYDSPATLQHCQPHQSNNTDQQDGDHMPKVAWMKYLAWSL